MPPAKRPLPVVRLQYRNDDRIAFMVATKTHKDCGPLGTSSIWSGVAPWPLCRLQPTATVSERRRTPTKHERREDQMRLCLQTDARSIRLHEDLYNVRWECSNNWPLQRAPGQGLIPTWLSGERFQRRRHQCCFSPHLRCLDGTALALAPCCSSFSYTRYPMPRTRIQGL